MAEQNMWWLSFCDGNLPEGRQFLGCAIVPGTCIATAAISAHALGCNPGGEVLGVAFPDDMEIPDGYAVRLLTKAEALELDRMWEGD